MTEYNSLNKAIQDIYGESVSVESRTPVSGGDINRAYALALSDGTRLFMKANSKSNIDFFRCEAEGLAAIRSTEAINAPEVIAIGTDDRAAFLLLEYIESGHRRYSGSPGTDPSEKLGTALAAMHLSDASRFVEGGRYGFLRDNFIGAGVQLNSPEDTWTEFFINQRLMPQFERAGSYFDRAGRKKIDVFLGKADRYLAEPDAPALLHGDLWAGNYMIDSDGEPWLIDPAAYVGHAEADLAMTELFGGFNGAFYESYDSIAGIDPWYKDRRDLYNLYHLLNHLNLFGGSYLYSVSRIIERYAG